MTQSTLTKLESASEGSLLLKPFETYVSGYPQRVVFFAKSRGKALAKCWRSLLIAEDVSFKDALSRITVRRCEPPHRFGERIMVGGELAYFVVPYGSQIKFVRPNSETILVSHPADVKALETGGEDRD